MSSVISPCSDDCIAGRRNDAPQAAGSSRCKGKGDFRGERSPCAELRGWWRWLGCMAIAAGRDASRVGRNRGYGAGRTAFDTARGRQCPASRTLAPACFSTAKLLDYWPTSARIVSAFLTDVTPATPCAACVARSTCGCSGTEPASVTVAAACAHGDVRHAQAFRLRQRRCGPCVPRRGWPPWSAWPSAPPRGRRRCSVAALRIGIEGRQNDQRAADHLDCRECFHSTLSYCHKYAVPGWGRCCYTNG